jgi:hypothetical protein
MMVLLPELNRGVVVKHLLFPIVVVSSLFCFGTDLLRAADDVVDRGDPNLRVQYEQVAQKAEVLVKQYLDSDSSDEQRQRTKQSLADLIGQAFELRQQLHRSEVQAARKELDTVEKRISDREKLKETIIRRRVEDLLIGNDVDWTEDRNQASSSKVAFKPIQPGDVVGIYIEGVLPFNSPNQPPEPPPITPLASGAIVTGFPIAVAEDGTVQLPLVEPISISGLTIRQAEKAIGQKYIDEGILRPEKARPMVTMIKRME